MSDAKNLQPGTMLRNAQFGGTVILRERKPDQSGWWNTDGSGRADRVIANGSWVVVTDTDDEERQAQILARLAAERAVVSAAIEWRSVLERDADEAHTLDVFRALQRSVDALLSLRGEEPDDLTG